MNTREYIILLFYIIFIAHCIILILKSTWHVLIDRLQLYREYENQSLMLPNCIDNGRLVWKHLTFLVTAGSVLCWFSTILAVYSFLGSDFFVYFSQCFHSQKCVFGSILITHSLCHFHATSKAVSLIQTSTPYLGLPCLNASGYLHMDGYQTNNLCSTVLKHHFPT